eukprot:g65337.t1
MSRFGAPVPRTEWVPDEDAPNCMKCNSQFTCFFRRHHCRFCGLVVCSLCSEDRISGERSCVKCKEAYGQAMKLEVVASSSPSLRNLKRLSPSVQRDSKSSPNLLASPHMTRTIQHMNQKFGVGQPLRVNRTMSSDSIESGFISRSYQGPEQGPPQVKGTSCMVVVDPLSTGAVLVAEILTRGCKVIRVFSDVFPAKLMDMVLDGLKIEYAATVQHRGDLNSTLEELQDQAEEHGLEILGVTPGCETGVELADALSEALDLRTNGTDLSDCRRHKFRMTEQVRRKGVPAASQALASTLSQCDRFLKQLPEGPMKVVIKPVESAGSDSVYVCTSQEEVRRRFIEITGKKNILGKENTECVLQEFLEGKEYVVDTVSSEGLHKCVCLWEYDKRPTNGAPFVYYGLRMKDSSEPGMKEMVEYTFRVLDALGIQNGCGHAEVIITRRGPILVEVGSRPHGGEGCWVPMVYKVLGTSQVKALTDLYLDYPSFAKLPVTPQMTNGLFGLEFNVVSRKKGKVICINQDIPRQCKTFLEDDYYTKVGDELVLSIDCVTIPCSVRLVGNREHVEKDYAFLRETEDYMFWVEGETPVSPPLPYPYQPHLNFKPSFIPVEVAVDSKSMNGQINGEHTVPTQDGSHNKQINGSTDGDEDEEDATDDSNKNTTTDNSRTNSSSNSNGNKNSNNNTNKNKNKTVQTSPTAAAKRNARRRRNRRKNSDAADGMGERGPGAVVLCLTRVPHGPSLS